MRWPYVYNSSHYRPLHLWYNKSREDNRVTSDPSWATEVGRTRLGYVFVREEGQVIAPDASRPKGTSPLRTFYSAARDDYATTTDSDLFAGGEPRERDYTLDRLEGYVFDNPLAGTVPLRRWFNSSRGDHFTTSDPRWRGRLGEERDGYVLKRVEGHVLSPFTAQKPNLPERFGAGSSVRGDRPLLLVLVNFQDHRVHLSEGAYENLFFGSAHPNLRHMFRTLSNGRFTWRRASVQSVTFPAPASEASTDRNFDERVLALAADAGVDFSRYDDDHDGTVTGEDLGILFINASYSGRGGGQTRSFSTVIAGLTLTGRVSACDEYGGINLFAHELFHQLGFDQHIYGPSKKLNYRASTFAATPSAPDHRPIQLDPWHAMRAGWLRPRIFTIGDDAGSAYLEASAVHHYESELGCIAFHDPARGPREILLLEYRNPSPVPGEVYDAGALEPAGVAVWYVRHRDGVLEEIVWPPGSMRGGHAYADYLLGPDGPGAGPFWGPAHGAFEPRWPDGALSGLVLRVGRIGGPKTAVQWHHAGRSFLPRLDDVRPDTVSPGDWLTLDGMFGVDPTLNHVMLVGNGDVVTILERMDSSTAVRLVVRLSETTRTGDYTVVVRTRDARSNAIRLRVLP